MEAYTGFAYVYDEFMDNIPYDQWSEYLIELLKKNGIVSQGSNVVELGCGTGNMTQRLAKIGYQMIGIDNSEDMLSMAYEKMYANNLRIMYSNQDMCQFELPYKVKAIVSVCDSMNYITSSDNLLKTFKCVKKYLQKSGVFIFDMKTRYFYEQVLADHTYAENHEKCSYIWDNYYYKEQSINEYNLTIFKKENNGLYTKYEEIHQQRAYTIEEIEEIANVCGLEIVNVYDAFTYENASGNSERLYFVAKVKSKINIIKTLIGK